MAGKIHHVPIATLACDDVSKVCLHVIWGGAVMSVVRLFISGGAQQWTPRWDGLGLRKWRCIYGEALHSNGKGFYQKKQNDPYS